MPDKVPTYRIDESLLRSKLLGYNVEFNSGNCSAIESEVSSLRLKKSIALPNINLKKALPVVAAVLVVIIVSFNLDSISALFNPAPAVQNNLVKVSKPSIQKPAEQKAAQVTQTVTASPVVNTASVATNGQVSPSPTNLNDKSAAGLPETKKQDPTVSVELSKKASPVAAQPPLDSSSKKNEVLKQDSSVQNAEPAVHKKKKRKRRNANMEELKESTLQSGSADDDVVVPQ